MHYTQKTSLQHKKTRQGKHIDVNRIENINTKNTKKHETNIWKNIKVYIWAVSFKYHNVWTALERLDTTVIGV